MSTTVTAILVVLGLVAAFVGLTLFSALITGLAYRVSFWAAGVDTKDIGQVLKHLGKDK